MPRSIQILIHPESTPEKQKAALDAVLARLRELTGISDAQPLDATSCNMEVLRLGYAYVKDDANIHQLCSLIAAQPGVEKAELPSPRRLVE